MTFTKTESLWLINQPSRVYPLRSQALNKALFLGGEGGYEIHFDFFDLQYLPMNVDVLDPSCTQMTNDSRIIWVCYNRIVFRSGINDHMAGKWKIDHE